MDDEGTQWTSDGRTSEDKPSMMYCILQFVVESGLGVAAAACTQNFILSYLVGELLLNPIYCHAETVLAPLSGDLFCTSTQGAQGGAVD